MAKKEAGKKFDSCKNAMLLTANEWNRLRNSRLYVVIEIFKIEKFLRDFVLNVASLDSGSL